MIGTRTGRVVVRVAVALLALAVWLAPRAAAAHGEEGHEPTPSPTPAARDRDAPEPTPTDLELDLPEGAQLGEKLTIRAVLLDVRGRPIEGAAISFVRSGFQGGTFGGEVVLGIVMTGEDGMATLDHEVRTSGDVHVSASFAGDANHRGTTTEGELVVEGDRQLYAPTAGIRLPWLNVWVLAGVIALVWILYLRVGLLILAIAGSSATSGASVPAAAGVTRRQLLRRVLPLGSQLGIAGLGVGLVALVVRSPRTHGNLLQPPATERYSRTPVARLGRSAEMRPMPEPLTRAVSFSREVLPILLAYGGPHVVQPRNSPPPGGLRLDAYEHIMAREGIVVPGEPEESEIVEHLLSPGMQMPPSVAPIPDEQIQLIVTWIAQGAADS